MRVAAWCWEERGHRLVIAGDLGEGAALALAAEAAGRDGPFTVSMGTAALSEGARAHLRRHLPQPPARVPIRTAAHELRDALGILQLRMQLLAAAGGQLPAVNAALSDISRVVAAGNDLIAAAGQPA